MKRFFLIFAAFVCAMNLRATDVGVPAESEDVMLQCFYWDSYKSTGKYGCTTWQELTKDSAAITANFDLVWFPPSGWAGDGTSGGVGYYHRQVSQQNSSWGYRIDLYRFMQALHRGNTKCIADIVINHRNNKSNWCDFFEDNFTYSNGTSGGKFQFTSAHICSGDECFSDSKSTCYQSSTHGAADTGTNDAGCRDLDHSNEYVRSWAKAYVNWMLGEIGYDGFRYDMTLGYSGAYLSEYNEASNPYISVSEYWESIDKQVSHLQAAKYNTMIFDFPLKYVMNTAFKQGTYGQLKNPSNSLRGKGYKKYSVTFIDNHDTFERSDNQSGEFIKYNADLNTADVKNKILQANAYILMMPGIPCVFWPHWRKYSSEISQMIGIRKLAGIHSESEVSNEQGGTYAYSAEIQGHYRKVYLRLGKNRDKTQPANTYKAMDGEDYTIFVEVGSGIDEVTFGRGKGTKIVRNGQLYIRHGDKMYDMMGRLVEE